MNHQDHVSENIYKKVLLLAVPMMVQNAITNAVGLVDNIMVGALGTESMTAVSIVGQLMFVFFLAIFGGLSGPAIYGAQYYGQGNMEGFRNVFRLKWWIVAGCVLAGLLVFLTLGSNLIGLYLNGSADGLDPDLTMNLGMQYLDIMLIGLLPFAVTQIYAGSLRETGKSVLPMVAGIISVFVDVIFNYLLIFGKFGFPEWGVRGAAVATVLSRFVELLVIVVFAHLQKDRYTFLKGAYRTFKLPMDVMGVIIKKSIPIFLNEFMWAGGIAALTQCYSIRGLSIVAGLNISNAICNLLNVVFVALGGAVGILIGQMLGASEYDRAKKSSIQLMWFTGAICIVLTVILVGISGVFPKLYNTSEDVRRYATQFIIVSAAFFPVQGFLNSLYFTLRSGGKTVITFLFDSVYSWGVAVSLAAILCFFTTLPIIWVFTIVQAADLIKVVVGYILIQKGIWITNLVEDL